MTLATISTLVGVAAYVLMRDVGRPFALAFALLAAAAIPVVAFS